MTPAEFRDALDSLGWTQSLAARVLQCDERTVRRWACAERAIPGPVVAYLALVQGVRGAKIFAERQAPPSPTPEALAIARREVPGIKPADVHFVADSRGGYWQIETPTGPYNFAA